MTDTVNLTALAEAREKMTPGDLSSRGVSIRRADVYMIRVEPLHRQPLPDWAIWSFMAGLYFATGYEGQMELAIVNLMSVTRLMHQGEN